MLPQVVPNAVRPEDTADIGGVLLAGIEVDVVGNDERHAKLHRGGRLDQVLDGGTVLIRRQPPGDFGANLSPRAVSGR